MIRPYPLKLKAVVKDYIWGGTKLKTDFGFESETEKLAEAWVFSCNKDGESTVVNGELCGNTLSVALAKMGIDYKECFPILIKLIDANDFLSIQVHPDETVAKELSVEAKNEMWYVLDADKDAFLYCGFKRTLNDDELLEAIKNNTITEVLNKIPVKPGDAFYIPAGTVHAIGKGILIAEVQQDSNTTFRVYDYDRIDKLGNKRELHIDNALKSINKAKFSGFNKLSEYLCNSPYFKVKSVKLEGLTSQISSQHSALLVVSGSVNLEFEEKDIMINKGECAFIPKDLKYNLVGSAELLITSR